MKNVITIFCFMCATSTMAQTLNNEWIDYSKTYFKFKVGTTGVCRISQTTLQANGLANTPAQNFQLWRNGVEVPIYSSVTSGVLGATDYLEFYGIINDGKPDKILYRNATDQLNDRVSLETDTSAYFLTINTTTNNARFLQQSNNVASNTLTVEPYFMYTDKNDFKEKVNPGFANTNYSPEYIYSSCYEAGEMLTSGDLYNYSNYGRIKNFYPYSGGGTTSTLTFGTMGSAPNNRNVNITLNGNVIGTVSLNSFESKSQQVTGLPVSNIITGANQFLIKNLSSNANDRININFLDLTYPRLFNFDNQTVFEFELPAKSAGQYIEIKNFNASTSTPVLYDLSNNRRYSADILAGALRFALPSSSAVTKYVLCSEDASQITNIVTLKQRTFINYSLSANQGDYLIISNSILYAPVNGSNPVEQYRAYRSTIAGGGYTAKTYDIDQLEDQFAFGIRKHPLSVKNFLRFARLHFATAPKFAFLIGKGVNYQDFYAVQNQAASDQLNLVPSFGYPASDILLASDTYDPYPATLIGRLAAITSTEVSDYLDKVKQYETTQSSISQTQADKLWQKNIVHVLGSGGDANLHYSLVNYFTGYSNIIKDTLYGGNVITLDKLDASTATNISTDLVNQLFINGFSLLNYFGHSSSTVLDFNLQDPTSYTNNGKYPMFMVSGCNAGDIFTYDVNRLSFLSTISDKYVLAKNLGSIGMIASTNFGLTGPIDTYTTGFYNSVDKKSYGKSIGQNISDACQYIMGFNTNPLTNFETRVQAEDNLLHGDPAIKINSFAKPDFSVEKPNILINPTFISVAANQFNVKIYHYNLGKAIKDSIRVQVKRKYPVSNINPNGATDIVYDAKIVAPKFEDSISLTLPIIANRDKGTNTITVSLETENRIDELSELNNTASQDFTIFEDELTPVYPYNFSIVTKASFKFIASTSNPFSTSKLYRLEMDTTELFNSPLLASSQVTQVGGEVEFTPPISSLIDGKVYYWRVAPIISGKPSIYQTASFLYSPSSGFGWNQSHLYQHFKSSLSNIILDSTTRNFSFSNLSNNLQINHGYYFGDGISGAVTANDVTTFVNGQANIFNDCSSPSILFLVFDNVHFRPWVNYPGGLYGSVMNNCTNVGTQNNFEFNYAAGTPKRKAIMDFMNLIPDGYFVVAKLVPYPYPNDAWDSSYTANWWKDTLTYGSGQSLPNYFIKQGFTDIGQETYPRLWTFVYKKNDMVHFKPVSKFSINLYDKTSVSVDCSVPDTVGTIASPVFGPAKQWQQVHWRGHPSETASPYPDSAILQVVGISAAGSETILYNLNRAQQDFDISAVSAVTYPTIRLRLLEKDTLHATPWQLDYWRINYLPVPEGALAPNLLFTTKDTLQSGETYKFSIAFKNISDVKFSDSIKVKAIVVDKNNTQHIFPIAKKKDLAVGDTITVSFSIDSLKTKDYLGTNNIFLDINPDSAQPEQYHFNNFLYRDFYVKVDNLNPILDVTFDGIHILNRDIVSSKPHIQIKLKDESQFVALNDTSEMKLVLRYPDGTTRTYKFGTDTLRFTPATLVNGDNTATIDFYPLLNQDSQDLDYELTVTAKDGSGNKAGPTDYHINFQVFNKPMISNMFNYPNPFTTSTAFVFTITGSEIPQEFKIQILTITGKIVREVTKAELGPLTIGRNITEFKWDGTDQYGSKLANGVYIYRVVTGLNGKAMDKFRINDNYDQKAEDQTDKYFNKGYGKMYLMR